MPMYVEQRKRMTTIVGMIDAVIALADADHATLLAARLCVCKDQVETELAQLGRGPR